MGQFRFTTSRFIVQTYLIAGAGSPLRAIVAIDARVHEARLRYVTEMGGFRQRRASGGGK